MVKGNKKTTKGRIVWDTCADYELSDVARKHGWVVKTIPPNSKRLKDENIASIYARGVSPIFTHDHTAFMENPSKNGATGYVEQDAYSPEQFNEYKLKVEDFFKKHTSKSVKNKIIKIPLKGKIIVKNLCQKKEK